ncbi:MAG: hypothetical protein WC624_05570 [Candidatus Margulisiibacteriota bacterium]
MKKFIICLVAFAFVAAIANLAFGRTMQEEMDKVRDYLNVVDAKLATAKQAKNKKKVDLLHAEKSATLARWNKLKASMVTEQAPVAPAPIIVTPTPVVVVTPTPEAGRGVALYLNGGLDAGLIGFSGNLDYDLSGLSIQGASVRVGANYVSGNNPNGGDSMKALFAKLGAVYYITPYMPDLGVPLTWYVGGAYLLPVKVNNARTGVWGLEAYLGTNYVVPELGIINFEIGYAGLKYASSQPSLKGIDLKLGYGIKF